MVLSRRCICRIIYYLLEIFLYHQTPEEQSDFVKGKGTQEQILNIWQIIEKGREFNVPFYLCFVDYQKAFDTVN